MNWNLSERAEEVLGQLEADRPDMYELVLEDLHLLHLVDVEQLEVWSEVGTFQYLTGPSGRVRYWVGVMADDRCLIEDLEAD
jgi:hypothetical protein